MKKQDSQFTKQRAQHLLTLDDAMPSMYMADITRMFDCTVSAAVEGRGVAKGHRRILMNLAREDGVTQLRLVKLTHLTPPTVSVSLSKMEEDGLVKRVADEKDLRQVRVYLTDKGRELNDFYRAKCREADRKMLEGISPQEQQQLTLLLRKMLINMLEDE